MKDQKVREYSDKLKSLGISHEILEHPELVSVEDVQKYLGFGLDEALATLIMKTEHGYVAVIRRGDCTLDNKQIKKILGVESLRLATDEEFTKLTRVVPGAAHILHTVDQTLIDKKIFEKEMINGGSGSLLYTFRYKTSELKKIPKSQIAEITKISVTTTSTATGVKRVFSGIRATGRLHLGNYLGAVKGFLEIQEKGDYEMVYCVVDVHSITTPFKPEDLKKNKREIIIDYLAVGLNPEKSILIYQSDIPEHTELAFYFSTVVTIARMMHLPTYKDKVKQHPNANTMALLNYPVLMAADILIYKAGLVPVGIDQEPHLEVAREIARKMNQLYGTDFPEPVRFATKGEYIPSLTGEGKMGKTVEGSYINLTDTLDEIRKKVRSIPTATVSGGELTGGLKSLFTFADLFINKESVEGYKKEFEAGTLQFVKLKDAVSEAIYKELETFQKKRAEIASNQEYVDQVIKDGAEKARKIARDTIREVKEKMGLL